MRKSSESRPLLQGQGASIAEQQLSLADAERVWSLRALPWPPFVPVAEAGHDDGRMTPNGRRDGLVEGRR